MASGPIAERNQGKIFEIQRDMIVMNFAINFNRFNL